MIFCGCASRVGVRSPNRASAVGVDVVYGSGISARRSDGRSGVEWNGMEEKGLEKLRHQRT